MINKLYQKKPCNECPFRKGSKTKVHPARAEEILIADKFVCHKTMDTKKEKQCAGHMIVNKHNLLWRLANIYDIEIKVSGEKDVYTQEEFLKAQTI